MNTVLQIIRVACLVALPAQKAVSLVELDDTALSGFSGQAIMFNLLDFSLEGDMSLTYRGEGDDEIRLSNLEISRTNDPKWIADDPYRLEVVNPAEGLPDAIRISGPSNAHGSYAWHIAADWNTYSNGTGFSGGAFVLQDFLSRESSFTLSPPGFLDGAYIVFGASVGFEVGEASFMPRGRDNGAGALSFSGIEVGASGGGPWQIASIDNQPGRISAVADGDETYIEIEIDWPKNGYAPAGKISIDNINLFIPSTGLLGQLAPARVGFAVDRVQLQYLNIRLHP